MGKRERQRELRRLLGNWCRGLISSMRYQTLQRARAYATEHHLPWPAWARLELRRAAREWLADVVDYHRRRAALAAPGGPRP